MQCIVVIFLRPFDQTHELPPESPAPVPGDRIQGQGALRAFQTATRMWRRGSDESVAALPHVPPGHAASRKRKYPQRKRQREQDSRRGQDPNPTGFHRQDKVERYPLKGLDRSPGDGPRSEWHPKPSHQRAPLGQHAGEPQGDRAGSTYQHQEDDVVSPPPRALQAPAEQPEDVSADEYPNDATGPYQRIGNRRPGSLQE